MDPEKIVLALANENRQEFEQIHHQCMSWFQFLQLMKQGYQTAWIRQQLPDHRPVVKLKSRGPESWLVSELLPEEPDIAVGLHVTGEGELRSGSFSIRELLRSTTADQCFKPSMTIREYLTR